VKGFQKRKSFNPLGRDAYCEKKWFTERKGKGGLPNPRGGYSWRAGNDLDLYEGGGEKGM